METNKRQKTVVIPNFIDMVDVLGPKDRYLDLIKKDTDAKITVRDKTLYLFGEEAEIQRLLEVFDKILEVLGQGEKVIQEDVELFLRQSKEEGIYSGDNEGVILKYGKKEIRVKTQGQLEYLRSMRNNDITICESPCGTSKTYTSVCYALSLLLNKDIDRIILTRPMVAATGEQDLGALPGEVRDKVGIWNLPMTDVFSEILGEAKFESYVERGKIKMLPLGYMRGLSLKHSFILGDEFQSSSVVLAKLLITRMGEASKVVVCGDPIQQDNKGMSGLTYLANALKEVPGVGIIHMQNKDIVRHPLIPRLLKAFEQYDNKLEKIYG